MASELAAQRRSRRAAARRRRERERPREGRASGAPSRRIPLPSRGSQVLDEPVARQARYGLQGPRLLEEVRSARHDLELLIAGEPVVGLAVQLEDLEVVSPDDQ